MMAWGIFLFFLGLMLIGLYTLKEPLMVKGYCLMESVELISSSFTVSKLYATTKKTKKTTILFSRMLISTTRIL
ncbi:YiaA/YiaB family inner membrane protein [Streptococcus pluranimalium]|uniref:YiaA/YiaB family inner membrane protein n=2 Tax=Streptococcus pluranimalium TaxID=82348 RepID=UPI003F692A85